MFTVQNGVKQGGVISPVLFCIYIDLLFENLKNSGIGCHMGPYFAGAFAYADDIILLNPSVTGTTKMLNICSSYAKEHSIAFNAKKSYVFVSGKADLGRLNIKLNGEALNVVDRVSHLGHILDNNVEGYFDMYNVINCFNKSVNALMAEMGFVQSSILYRLFEMYCSSYYGIVLCKLKSAAFDRFCTSWRKAMRRVYKLPATTHCKYVNIMNG